MAKYEIIVMAIHCYLVWRTNAYTIYDTDRLYADLLENYNKNTRASVNQSTATTLHMQFSITSINGLDEVTGTFTLVGYFDMEWQDARMTWDPSAYNGVDVIAFPQTKVWVPVLIHGNGNGNGGLAQLGKDWLLARYLPDGTARWSPGHLFKSYCAPLVRDYPYDTQKCSLHLVPWGYSPDEIKFNLTRSSCITDLYLPNGVWALQNTSVYVIRVYSDLEKVVVEFTLKRRATFFVVNMILPIAAIGAMDLLVFFLPPQSGERVGYSVTLLLAISVFLTIASDNLPKTSFPDIPYLCVKLLVDVMISSSVVLFAIVGLRFYHKDQNSDVPSYIASLTQGILCIWNRRKNKINIVPQETTEKKSGQETDIHTNGKEPKLTAWSAADLPIITEKKVTWVDVGKASDIVFFVITFVLFSASHVSYVIHLNHV